VDLAPILLHYQHSCIFVLDWLLVPSQAHLILLLTDKSNCLRWLSVCSAAGQMNVVCLAMVAITSSKSQVGPDWGIISPSQSTHTWQNR
jgi:hypothetical protein